MKNISISKDIIPLGEFKSGISRWINKLKVTGHPVVITQNGRPAAVMITPDDFDDLQRARNFMESISRGMEDAESGNVFSTDQVISELEKRRKNREKVKSGLDK